MAVSKLDKKQKIIISAVGGILLLLFFNKIIIGGINEKTRVLERQIKLAEAKLVKDTGIQKDKDNLLYEYNAYQSYFKYAKQDQTLIISDFMKEIERLAKETGVSIVALSPRSEPEKLKEAVKYKADLKVEGTLAQVLTFMCQIRDNKLLIGFDKVLLAPKDETGLLIRLEGVISIIAL
ncbi:MAG: hypothetical protein WBE75_02855 [Candidatus Omnitrophota bacterium]|jgi:hypothetical protein